MIIVNIYAMPRSGTNFLANWLFMNYNINTVNSGGGRYPLRTFDKQHTIYKPSGMYRENCTDIVRDEMSFTLNGGKRRIFSHWISQFMVRTKGNYNYVLLRDPIDTSISMHNYYLKYGTHKHWNMEDKSNLLDFVKKYSDLSSRKLHRRYNIRNVVSLTDIANGQLRSSFNEILKPIERDILYCGDGHLIQKLNGEYQCECGTIRAQGTTSVSTTFDIGRYTNLTPTYDIGYLKQLIGELDADTKE